MVYRRCCHPKFGAVSGFADVLAGAGRNRENEVGNPAGSKAAQKAETGTKGT